MYMTPNPKYNLGYHVISLSPPSIRSTRSLGSTISAGTPCGWCSSLKFDVQAVQERGNQSYTHVRVEERLNHVQLHEKLADLKEQVNDLKLETLNLNRSLASAREHVAEYRAIFRFLGTNTVPGLHRIFPNALKQEWGSKKFLAQIQAASEGDYIPRNYTQYEIDLAIALYELGGGSAVYAMNHSIFALPSLNTLQPYRRQHRPKPCLDHVDLLTISDNIATMFGPHEEKGRKSREAPIQICGHTLMFDELATERKVDYMSTTDEMAGFCLEHVRSLESLVVGKDTKTVEAAVTAVNEGKVHIAHEATVASDGDYARRIALFMLCMHSEILPGNPLYALICNLRGFNRRVGKDNIAMDMDYRHLLKRLCTLLRSWMGMLVKGDHDWSETSIENLLHATDAQNVSRAVKLLLCIVEIRTIDKDDLDPSEEAEFEALCLLGEMFEFLVTPFINPRLSLSQQLTSLVTFAHLACGLFLQNSTSFMSNQLYGDLQAMVKAAILMVAKTQVLDPRLEVLLCLLGDNPVETFFGRSRMCGGHSPNCSISELWTRFCSAMNLHNVFNHHPELERNPRRLKLVRARDADHVGPKVKWSVCAIPLQNYGY
ncbi:hypothetical protein B0H13DRAFT_1852120 [Mycena leptocephala]|nr:hypothetical protein B0H13DRAFT_1852120 [Mycena leptocephala]